MMPPQLDIFNGTVTSLQTVVYARVTFSVDSDPQHCELLGTIDGPYSDYARTLPAKYKLVDCVPGDSMLAKASIPDPCVWTPDMPVRYRLAFELRGDAQTIETGTREFGLRDLATHQQSILSAGKRRVIRGVGYERVGSTELSQWRNTASAMLVTDPDDTLCESASRAGVTIVAQVTMMDNLEDHIRRIAAHPSVIIVWLGDGCADRNWRQLAPNVLFARSFPFSGDDESWTDVLVCEITGQPPPQIPTDINKPILALRPLSKHPRLSVARAACDELQRDLAPRFNLAGYLV